MPIEQLPTILRYLRRVRDAEKGTNPSDRVLLERFVRGSDQSAFTDLVQRHGPMVLGVCRRVLGDWQEAEDAFQTTFLVLVRKASFLRKPDALGPWLHGVAYRTALKARGQANRRLHRQQPLDDCPAPSDDAVVQRELRAILDEAINRLPSRYRTAVILCDLEGLSHVEAGRQLGCPTNTVSTHLVRARARLRTLLSRRGLAVQAGLLTAALASPLSAAVSPLLLRAALAAVAGTVSPSVALLLKGVCKSMFLAKIRMTVLLLAAVATLGLGAGAFAYLDPGKKDEKPVPAPPPPPLSPMTENLDPPADEKPVKLRTTNFEIHAPTRRIAQLIGAEAERQRKAQAVRWLGEEMPVWTTPCQIKVKLKTNGSNGATAFAFDQGRILSMDMLVEGALDHVLINALPHEITHTVLAHYFRGPVPRWADEGCAILSEDEEEQQRYSKLVREILNTSGRSMPLKRLLALTNYPPDMMVLYAQGSSLTRFLVDRKDHKTFLQFVSLGMKEDWDTAVRATYGGLEDVAALEKAWLADLRLKANEVSQSQLPRGPSPDILLAIVEPSGRLRISQAVSSTYYEPVTIQRTLGPGQGQTDTTYVEKRKDGVQQSFHDLKDIKAFRSDGKPIEPKRLRHLLEKETAVLVSRDGNPVDPFYLQVIKEGTVVLVVSRGPSTPPNQQPIAPSPERAPPPAPLPR
jgi:RNA polymerase sigma factor (sigma-70 family)